MNQTSKVGAFSKQKFFRAVREETSILLVSLVLASMVLTAFKNYAKHHNNGTLFAGWTMAVLFAWAVSFIVRNIIRASR